MPLTTVHVTCKGSHSTCEWNKCIPDVVYKIRRIFDQGFSKYETPNVTKDLLFGSDITVAVGLIVHTLNVSRPICSWRSLRMQIFKWFYEMSPNIMPAGLLASANNFYSCWNGMPVLVLKYTFGRLCCLAINIREECWIQFTYIMKFE